MHTLLRKHITFYMYINFLLVGQLCLKQTELELENSFHIPVVQKEDTAHVLFVR